LTELSDFLKKHSRKRPFSDGHEYLTVSNEAVHAGARSFDVPLRQVEILALEEGVVPLRYTENIPVFGIQGQLKVRRSSAAVIGTGGLGGYVCELLARAGVGRLVMVDGDRFEESNLNRQVLSAESNLGEFKVEVAERRVREINDAVDLYCVRAFATEKTLPQIVKDCHVVVDCVDTARARLMLQKVCEKEGIPLVHGSIGGCIGRVMTILPGDVGVRAFYREPGHEMGLTRGESGEGENRREEIRRQETRLEEICREEDRNRRATTSPHLPSFVGPTSGSPGVTPAAVAPWQAAEALKVITGKGTILRNEILVIDLLNGRVGIISLRVARLGRLLAKAFGSR